MYKYLETPSLQRIIMNQNFQMRCFYKKNPYEPIVFAHNIERSAPIILSQNSQKFNYYFTQYG